MPGLPGPGTVPQPWWVFRVRGQPPGVRAFLVFRQAPGAGQQRRSAGVIGPPGRSLLATPVATGRETAGHGLLRRALLGCRASHLEWTRTVLSTPCYSRAPTRWNSLRRAALSGGVTQRSTFI